MEDQTTTPSTATELNVFVQGNKFRANSSYYVRLLSKHRDEPPNEPFHLVGQTESVNSKRPMFTTVFNLKYEVGTILLAEVMSCRPSREDHLYGKAQYQLSDMRGNMTKSLARHLPAGGVLFLHAEQVVHLRETLMNDNGIMTCKMFKFKLHAILDSSQNKSKFFLRFNEEKPTCFFEILRPFLAQERKKWMTVYRSDVVVESSEPLFDTAELKLRDVCNDDLRSTIRISLYLNKRRGEPMHLGSCETNIESMLEKAKYSSGCGVQTNGYALENAHDGEINKIGRVEVSEGCIVHKEISETLSNMDRIQNDLEQEDDEGSCDSFDGSTLIQSPQRSLSKKDNTDSNTLDLRYDLDLCFAIDFTSSNGDPSIPGSLHYKQEGMLNDYEEAMLSVGEVLSKNNQKKTYPVWGFGCKFGDDTVRHIFRVGKHAEACGIVGNDGVLSAYQNVWSYNMTMSGPTNIIPVLQAAASRSTKYCDEELIAKYCIILILTDGIMQDMNSTINHIYSYSQLPMSIVLIGIGRADFSAFDEIHKLQDNEKSWRNNFTFIPSILHQNTPDSLPKVVLESITRQIQYFVKRR
mmetsp:Transcript_14177/g.20248  ORF Transcript_14177/g.20248 Transcript_14177/m.20248 type:complete len:579 (-) Transcript_14177:199-1935(-)